MYDIRWTKNEIVESTIRIHLSDNMKIETRQVISCTESFNIANTLKISVQVYT